MQTIVRTVMKKIVGNKLTIKKFDSKEIKTITKNIMEKDRTIKKEPLSNYSTSMIGYQHQLELAGYKEVKK